MIWNCGHKIIYSGNEYSQELCVSKSIKQNKLNDDLKELELN